MNESNYFFQKLTPVNDVDISVYEEAIDFALSNQDIKNVAISGAYCAGKSSILESYKSKHKNWRFINISLAHFNSSEQDMVNPQSSVKESVLEGKILNQLIHQIPTKKIPQTNFRIKRESNQSSIVLLTAIIFVIVLSVSFLFMSTKVSAFISTLPKGRIHNFLSLFTHPYAILLAIFVLLICSLYTIYSLITMQINKNILHKISLKGAEIEIFEKQDDSYFDKYLNEVLYLFENVEADVIVFEDMDRFNASQIFERLREVNTLVNVQKMKANDDTFIPLRFFYLLRDDIFISKDRTKFFDFIIPVVPVVDNSNSFQQFLQHLEKGGLKKKFDLSFLQGLSLYVDDMRILKNIYNEFILYFYRLNNTDLDYNKMLAIIAYKNLFPRDFSDLQLGRGFVYLLFAQKQKLIEQTLQTTSANRQELIERIKSANMETLESQEELADAYKAKETRLPKERFDTNRLTADSTEKKKQYDADLLRRKQAIQDVLDGALPKLESQLATIEHELVLIETRMLKDLLTRDNIDSFFSIVHKNEIGVENEFKEIRGSEYFALLKYLIRSGYVDETYTDYISYFYEDSICAKDKAFLRRITDKRGADFAYEIKDPKKVIDTPVLRTIDFEQEETLNFDIFEFLLNNSSNDKYEKYLGTLVAQIRGMRNFDFISKFLITGKAHDQLVVRMNELWPDFIYLALQDKSLSTAQIRQYTIDTLYLSDARIIPSLNINNCLTTYISNSPDYLAIPMPEVDKLIHGFLLINVSFSQIDYDVSDKDLFDGVYNNNLYAFTFDNISLMLKNECDIVSDLDIVHKNFTLVSSNPNSPLAKYVLDNINVYGSIIISHCKGSISDIESVALYYLNNTNIETATKTQYINLLTTILSDIVKVDDPELWKTIIKQKKVEFSENNFTNYFTHHGIDSALIEFINDVSAELNFGSIAKVFGEEVAEELFNEVAHCNRLNNDKYKKILNDLNYFFDTYEADAIDDDKFEVLIQEEILLMNRDSLVYVRGKYPKHLYTFIKKNLDEYIAIQTADLFSISEILQILSWDIDDNPKIQLLSITNEAIPIVGAQYTDKVNAFILSHNPEETDKNHLYSNYSRYGIETRNAISEMAIKNVAEIITSNIIPDDSLLSIMLQTKSIPRDQKIPLWALALPRLTEETCSSHFDELGLSELNRIFERGGGRRNYPKTEEVAIILETLKQNHWIQDYSIDDRNPARYVVRKGWF